VLARHKLAKNAVFYVQRGHFLAVWQGCVEFVKGVEIEKHSSPFRYESVNWIEKAGRIRLTIADWLDMLA